MLFNHFNRFFRDLESLDELFNEFVPKNQKTQTGTSKKAEPKQTAKGQIPIASTQQGIIAYQTKREFMAERNNPKFNTDPKFRNYVEQRMLRTDFTKLPK